MERPIKELRSGKEARFELGWANSATQMETELEEFEVPIRYFEIEHEHSNGSSIVAKDHNWYLYTRVTEDNDILDYSIDESEMDDITIETLSRMTEDEILLFFLSKEKSHSR